MNRNNPKLIFKGTRSGLHIHSHFTYIQEKTKHKLHLRHMCSLCWSLQGSEVNSKHAETLLEEHSWWIPLRSMLFIYPNSVKTSHLPSFLFNLQETKKNKSGFRRCVDPMMCRAVTPTYILLLISKTEIHPAILQDIHSPFPYTKYITNTTAM